MKLSASLVLLSLVFIFSTPIVAFGQADPIDGSVEGLPRELGGVPSPSPADAVQQTAPASQQSTESATPALPSRSPSERYTFVPLTGLPGVETVATSNSLSNFLNSLYRICVGLAAVLAVIQITRAGITYMVKDSFASKKDAKHLIQMSLFGLLLVLTPTIVFGIIDPRILSLKISAEGLAFTPATPFTTSADGGGGNGSNSPILTDADGACLSTEGLPIVLTTTSAGSAFRTSNDALSSGNGRYVRLLSLARRPGDIEEAEMCCTGRFQGVVTTDPTTGGDVCDFGELRKANLPTVIFGSIRGTVYAQSFLGTLSDIVVGGDGERPNAVVNVQTKGYFLENGSRVRNFSEQYAFDTLEECERVTRLGPDELFRWFRQDLQGHGAVTLKWEGFVAFTENEISPTSLLSVTSSDLHCDNPDPDSRNN